jgi:hypothetical protein
VPHLETEERLEVEGLLEADKGLWTPRTQLQLWIRTSPRSGGCSQR